jgi:SAM-dependent methyltransferase
VDDPRKRLVAEGYDRMAGRYAAWANQTTDEPRVELLRELVVRLPDGARILDLGCGAGATARALVPRLRVTGIDISPRQIDAAVRAVPEASFLVGDVASADFPPCSFDAAVALYAISHIPREAHDDLFGRIAGWIAPGGWLLATLGAVDAPDWHGTWLGVPMFFSAWDADTNRRLLREAGFDLVIDNIRTTHEPEGDVSFLWVLGRRREEATRRP